MQLNMTTDYAIRFLLCLENSKGPASGPIISEKTKITPKYLLKISAKLRKAGMIGSLAGSQGGYYLLKTLDQITLLEVINIMEPSSKWNRCLEEDSFCNNKAVMSCPIRKYYARLQEELVKKWLSKTLAEIVNLEEAEEIGNNSREKKIV